VAAGTAQSLHRGEKGFRCVSAKPSICNAPKLPSLSFMRERHSGCIILKYQFFLRKMEELENLEE
jgi:hypothetical protein